MSVETLFCENGHDWSRPLTRGRKPRFCPSHLPFGRGSEHLPVVNQNRPVEAPESPVEASEGSFLSAPVSPLAPTLYGAVRAKLLVERMKPLIARRSS